MQEGVRDEIGGHRGKQHGQDAEGRRKASDSNGASDGNLAQLSLRPVACWAFEEGSQQHQVFPDEVKGLLLFYAQSTLVVRYVDNQKPPVPYSLGLRDGERLIWAELSADLKYLLVHTMSRPQWIKIYSLEAGRAKERFLVQTKYLCCSDLILATGQYLNPLHFSIRRTGPIERVHWTEPNNLFIASATSIEFYQIPSRESLSLVEKASTRVLLAFTGVKGGKARLEGFFFKQDFVTKLPKLEIDLTGKDMNVTAHNFALCRLYERLFCAHIQDNQIALYQLSKTTIVKKATILLVGQPLPHRVRLQSVDNLLAVHNTDSKVTTLYDIRSFPLDDDMVRPFAASLPISPFSDAEHTVSLYPERWQYLQPNFVLDLDGNTLFEVILETEQIMDSFGNKELLIQFLLRRSNTHVITLNSIRGLIQEGERLMTMSKIFDAVASIADVTGMDKYGRMVNVATTRTMTVAPGSRSPLPAVSVIPRNTTPSTSMGLTEASRRDVHLSSPTATMADSPGVLESSSSLSSSSIPSSPSTPSAQRSLSASSFTPLSIWDKPEVEEEKRGKAGHLLLDQRDLYTNVFAPIDEMITQQIAKKGVDSKYFVSVITEYVRSLNFYKQNVEHDIYKLVIQHLITSNRYYQLHQFLQYHVINDSEPVAYQLLSVEKYYPPAYQLALDMLKRLSTSRQPVKDQIVEVLLTRNQVLPALRFSKNNADAGAPAKRFLEAALLQKDENLFYTVYQYFEKEGRINQECAPFIQAFCKMFPGPAQDSTSDPSPISSSAGPYATGRGYLSSSSDSSAPSSAHSSLTKLTDLNSSPYASPSPSPFSPRQSAKGGESKTLSRDAL